MALSACAAAGEPGAGPSSPSSLPRRWPRPQWELRKLPLSGSRSPKKVRSPFLLTLLHYQHLTVLGSSTAALSVSLSETVSPPVRDRSISAFQDYVKYCVKMPTAKTNKQIGLERWLLFQKTQVPLSPVPWDNCPLLISVGPAMHMVHTHTRRQNTHTVK